MTTLEVLIEARRYIARGWVQGTYAARAGYSHPRLLHTTNTDPEASHWCAIGAIGRAAGVTVPLLTHHTIDGLVQHDPEAALINSACHALRLVSPKCLLGGEPLAVSSYNDQPDTTQLDVLAWFDRAIELVQHQNPRLAAATGDPYGAPPEPGLYATTCIITTLASLQAKPVTLLPEPTPEPELAEV